MFTSVRVGTIVLALSSMLPAVTVGTLDTFSDGTTMGWGVGPGNSPAQPANVGTGGPAGAGDAYLQLTALGGMGPGSRLTVLGGPQWGGDYLEEGVSVIRMDVRNFGPDDLYLRLLFEAFPIPGAPPSDVALTADSVFVPAGSDWQTISFAVNPWNLISAGLGTPEGALMNVDVFRLFHNPQPAFPGPNVGPAPVNAVLGVDNLQATVPEPGTFAMLAGALIGVAAIRRKH